MWGSLPAGTNPIKSPFPAHPPRPPRRFRPGGAGPSSAAGTGPGPGTPRAGSARNGAASCGRTSASVGRVGGGEGAAAPQAGLNPRPSSTRSPWPASRSAAPAPARWTRTCRPGEGMVSQGRDPPEVAPPPPPPGRARSTPPPPPGGICAPGSPPPPPSPAPRPQSGASCAGAGHPPAP